MTRAVENYEVVNAAGDGNCGYNSTAITLVDYLKGEGSHSGERARIYNLLKISSDQKNSLNKIIDGGSLSNQTKEIETILTPALRALSINAQLQLAKSKPAADSAFFNDVKMLLVNKVCCDAYLAAISPKDFAEQKKVIADTDFCNRELNRYVCAQNKLPNFDGISIDDLGIEVKIDLIFRKKITAYVDGVFNENIKQGDKAIFEYLVKVDDVEDTLKAIGLESSSQEKGREVSRRSDKIDALTNQLTDNASNLAASLKKALTGREPGLVKFALELLKSSTEKEYSALQCELNTKASEIADEVARECLAGVGDTVKKYIQSELVSGIKSVIQSVAEKLISGMATDFIKKHEAALVKHFENSGESCWWATDRDLKSMHDSLFSEKKNVILGIVSPSRGAATVLSEIGNLCSISSINNPKVLMVSNSEGSHFNAYVVKANWTEGNTSSNNQDNRNDLNPNEQQNTPNKSQSSLDVNKKRCRSAKPDFPDFSQEKAKRQRSNSGVTRKRPFSLSLSAEKSIAKVLENTETTCLVKQAIKSKITVHTQLAEIAKTKNTKNFEAAFSGKDDFRNNFSKELIAHKDELDQFDEIFARVLNELPDNSDAELIAFAIACERYTTEPEELGNNASNSPKPQH